MKIYNWTDDRVEKLKKLWESGLSASQIAAELDGITRNAVIGKVHRLGLSGRARKSFSSAAPRQRKVNTRPPVNFGRKPRTRSAGNTALAAVFAAEADPVTEIEDNVIPIVQRRTLYELREGDCKWPIGEPGSPDFAFCGGRAIEEYPYCAHHCRIAYQPPSDRRRERSKR